MCLKLETVMKVLWEAGKGLTAAAVSVFFLHGLLLLKQRAILLLVLGDVLALKQKTDLLGKAE